MEMNTHLTGVILSDFKYEYARNYKRFYSTMLSVKRSSDDCDVIKLMVPEDRINPNKDYIGVCVDVFGNIRSRKERDHTGSHLKIYVSVKEMFVLDDASAVKTNENNQIEFTGQITKEPVYRTTPLGRTICELSIAVSRGNQSYDLIPCILWEENAKKAADYWIDDLITISGRLQSRTYDKKIKNGSDESKITFTVNEVSVFKVKVTRISPSPKAVGEIAKSKLSGSGGHISPTDKSGDNPMLIRRIKGS